MDDFQRIRELKGAIDRICDLGIEGRIKPAGPLIVLLEDTLHEVFRLAEANVIEVKGTVYPDISPAPRPQSGENEPIPK